MTSNHAIAYLDRDRGICSNCDDFLTCRFHSRDEGPVYFCDEFVCTSGQSKKRNSDKYGLPGQYEGQFVVKKPEKARQAFIGLCRTCTKLETCTLLKPGGGTFQCDSYEQRAPEEI